MQNAGYEIIARNEPVGAFGVVVGHNPKAPAPYVTWEYRKDSPENFYWGHYFIAESEALKDLYERI